MENRSFFFSCAVTTGSNDSPRKDGSQSLARDLVLSNHSYFGTPQDIILQKIRIENCFVAGNETRLAFC
jgi:hypothetical protein